MKITVTLKFDVDDEKIDKSIDGWKIRANTSLMNKVANVIEERIRQARLIQCNIGNKFRCR